MTIREYSARLAGLVIFRSILADPVVEKLRRTLALAGAESRDGGLALLDAAADFEAALFEHGSGSWSAYLENLVLESENVCIRRAARGRRDDTLEAALEAELDFLSRFAGLTWAEILAGSQGLTDGEKAGLDLIQPWRVQPCDLAAAYLRRAAEAGRRGYGMFARYHVFTVEQGHLVPVKHPDPQRLEELPGYEKEREKVVANTKALLEGKPANNVLLYGDAGTGKSSTVKAIANEYAGLGLRLVEVKKNQLYQIPDLMDGLAANPLKFILFIDDLSFTANDDNFAALKAILEGSVGGRAKNIAVYATSNRRHLIKETLTDRSGDDIHEMDTRQELMSLSARFGLTVTFQRPEKQRFAHIVDELAKKAGIDADPERLLIQAEAFALRAGGRSPRVAKQFIELYQSGVIGN